MKRNHGPMSWRHFVILNQEERWLEELSYQLQLSDEITASGATMTAPAATSDPRDWIDDERTFLSVQYDDWQQVIGDFRDSIQQTGPKLLAIIGSRRQSIDGLLTALISTDRHRRGSAAHDRRIGACPVGCGP
jgi:hypothetical protein